MRIFNLGKHCPLLNTEKGVLSPCQFFQFTVNIMVKGLLFLSFNQEITSFFILWHRKTSLSLKEGQELIDRYILSSSLQDWSMYSHKQVADPDNCFRLQEEQHNISGDPDFGFVSTWHTCNDYYSSHGHMVHLKSATMFRFLNTSFQNIQGVLLHRHMKWDVSLKLILPLNPTQKLIFPSPDHI